MPLTIPQIEAITIAANKRIETVFQDVGFAVAGQYMLSQGQTREVLNAFLSMSEEKQKEFLTSFNQ